MCSNFLSEFRAKVSVKLFATGAVEPPFSMSLTKFDNPGVVQISTFGFAEQSMNFRNELAIDRMWGCFKLRRLARQKHLAANAFHVKFSEGLVQTRQFGRQLLIYVHIF